MNQNHSGHSVTDLVTKAILNKNKQPVGGSGGSPTTIPSHIQVLLDQPAVQTKINKVFLGKNALPTGQERVLVSGDFNDSNQLVLVFDTGEKIITKPIFTEENIEQYLNVHTVLPESYSHIQFDLIEPTTPVTEGMLAWNDTDGTLDLGMKGGAVTLQLGQEEHVRILNKTGSTMLSPQVVRLSGAQGNRLTAELSIASSATFADNTFAVVTETILNNQQGFATTSGLVRDVDTSGFAEGADLYLSSTVSGAITTIAPAAPSRVVRIGYCVRSHVVNGSIFVAILEHPDIVELGSVKIQTPRNDEFLVYESTTGLWKNKTGSSGWRDLIQPVYTAGVPANNAPVSTLFGTSGLREELAFSLNNYVFCAPMHVNHDIKPGGKMYAHVHWSTTGGNTSTVKWELQISRALGHNQQSFGNAVSYFVEQAAHVDPWRHMITEVSDLNALTMVEPDELLLITLRRVTNGGTNNTATVFGLLVDLHYETDRDTTPNKTPNFYT